MRTAWILARGFHVNHILRQARGFACGGIGSDRGQGERGAAPELGEPSGRERAAGRIAECAPASVIMKTAASTGLQRSRIKLWAALLLTAVAFTA